MNKPERLKAIGALSAVAAAFVGIAPAAGAEPSAYQAALDTYEKTVAAERERVLASELSKDQRIREQGLYFIENLKTQGFNMYIAPRKQYPAMYLHQVFMPLELSFGLPSPNYVYRWAFLDGRHTYRVYGTRKGNNWATLQVMRGFWGDEIGGTLGNVDFDNLPKTADDSFEIFLGPNPPADPKGQVWVKLEPVDSVTLMLRDLTNDWSKDKILDVHIEILDRDPDASIVIPEAELARRLQAAARWVRYNVNFAMGYVKGGLDGVTEIPFFGLPDDGQIDPKTVNDPANYNQFRALYTPGKVSRGTSPLSCFQRMITKITPDEALILEIPEIKARFWDYQQSDIWGLTTDYTYHRGSISGGQARLDMDGVLRVVVSMKDPGYVNWLDPVGNTTGVVQLRRYKSENCNAPSVKKVKFADLPRNMPASSPKMTAEERKAEMAERQRSSLRRYGY